MRHRQIGRQARIEPGFLILHACRPGRGPSASVRREFAESSSASPAVSRASGKLPPHFLAVSRIWAVADVVRIDADGDKRHRSDPCIFRKPN